MAWRTHLIALAIGIVLGGGTVGLIGWQALSGARADVATARGNLDRAEAEQRAAAARARDLSRELQGVKSALRESQETVEQLRGRARELEHIIADSGTEIDALGGALGQAREAARSESRLIGELEGIARELAEGAP